MRNVCFKKGLVVGVLILFLSVGLQPALANEVSITKTSESKGDCGCQPVNRAELLRVKLLLIRIEAITNVILSKFGHIPEVAEKCQEITNRIETFKEMNNELKLSSSLWDFQIICSILKNYFGVLNEMYEWIWDLMYKIQVGIFFFISILYLIGFIQLFIFLIGVGFGCWDWHYP